MNAPEGYMADAQGRLVPMEQIKPVDMLRHELVMEKVQKVKALQNQMRSLKAEIMSDVEALISTSAEQYGVTIGGQKGNVTLHSFDGKFSIKRQISEHLTFDEQLQAAKALIDECLKEWTQGSPGELRAIVNDAFQVDKEGRITVGRILGLRRLNITDERWQQAMEAISNSLTITGAKAYFRAYERDHHGRMIAIPLDMAAL